ncbi:Uncharacterised protein [Mycoplasmopsis maculosa]|uniref:Uncharacterized protein n=1 Tax=Mycoplasmopsis maculosa TaxID=114885 RepID=A0A449B4W3_9BACT|nr:hypothetical protein [Mycoplasmopsis maculosa]VEU75568.1 Uncharacterised protein [Mycoplasmopsis maculosa]
MKSILKIINSLGNVTSAISGFTYSNSVRYEENNISSLDKKYDPLDKPDYKFNERQSFKSLEEFYNYYDNIVNHIDDSIKLDYAILKKMLNIEEDINDLPFEKYVNKNINIKSDQYIFNDLGIIWNDYIKIYIKNNYSYKSFLKSNLREKVKSLNDLEDSKKIEEAIFPIFNITIEDQSLFKVVVIEFEALIYLSENPEDESLFSLADELFKNNNGLNPSDIKLNTTLDSIREKVLEIRKHENKNLSVETASEIINKNNSNNNNASNSDTNNKDSNITNTTNNNEKPNNEVDKNSNIKSSNLLIYLLVPAVLILFFIIVILIWYFVKHKKTKIKNKPDAN